MEEGKTAAKPTDPTESGFTFGGWYTEAACTTEFDFSTAVTGDIILYAKWTEESTTPGDPGEDPGKTDDPGKTTYSISYDLNGGTLDGKTGVVTLQIEEGTVITLPKPAREGYSFDYWQGSRYEAGASYTVTGDHTFTAQWKANSAPAAPTQPTQKPENPVVTASPMIRPGTAQPGPAPAQNRVPRTGDESDIALWALIFGASALGLSAVLTRKKRTNR